MRIINIGIDLATKKLGVAILGLEKQPIVKQFSFIPYEENVIYKNIKNVCNWVMEQTKGIACDIKVGLEISNFSNPKLTQRFATYSGAFIALLSEGKNQVSKIEFKVFNSNAWQLKVPNIFNNTTREERKELTKQWILDTFADKIDKNLSDDEYDALAIAYFYNDIETTIESKERVNKTKKSLINSKISMLKQKLNIQKNKEKLKERLEKLYKRQTTLKSDKAIQNNLRKINEVVNELTGGGR